MDDIVLLTDAKVNQARMIKKILQIFCNDYGQLVSFNKSNLFVSSNVNDRLAKSLSIIIEIPINKQLGKYLRVPSLYKRVTRATYIEVLKRLQSKLQG